MRAGKQRHKVTIQKPTETRDAVGGVTTTWATLGTIWASVEPLSGKELLSADQLNSIATLRVRCRYIKNLTHECRIFHKGRSLEIVSAQNIGERGVEYEILCREDV